MKRKPKDSSAIRQLEKFEDIVRKACGVVSVLWEKDFPNFTITCYNINGEAVINQIFNDGTACFTYTICGSDWAGTENEINRIAKNIKRT